MNPIEQGLLAVQGVWRTLRAARLPALGLPWLVWAALMCALALGFAWGAHPALSWLAVPVANALRRGDVFRYPSLFEQLPAIVARIEDLASIVLVPLASGLTTAACEEHFSGRRPTLTGAWARVAPRAFALIVATLPITLGAWLLHLGADMLLATRISSFTRHYAPEVAAVATLAVRSLCAYAGATWPKGLLAAIVFTLLGDLLVAPFVLLVRQAPVVVDRGVPELVLVLLVARYVAGAIAGLAVAGAATLVFLSEVQAHEEGA